MSRITMYIMWEAQDEPDHQTEKRWAGIVEGCAVGQKAEEKEKEILN